MVCVNVTKLLRVCVIGAGPSGLTAARHLTSQLDVFDVSVFEQAPVVGGTWVYNENTGSDERVFPMHSSIYRNLRTNLPKQVMAFPEFPFPSECTSFLSHQQVLKYLEDYTSYFDLYKYIQFNSAINSVRPVTSEDTQKPQWEVVVTNADTGKSRVLLFEAVIVCNGHFSVPFVPVIPGLESFPGLVIHSRDYRHPDVFQEKRVVIVGAGNSGQDICLEAAKCAKKVYLSHKSTLPCKLPHNVKEHRPITSISKDGTATFDDGQHRKVDAILLCTGYNFSFPFLHNDCGIQVRNNRVTHLYKHIFNTKYPTLTFIGLGLRICPFLQFSLQAQYVSAVLSARKKLPTEAEMIADEENDFKETLSCGLSEKYAHCLGERQWDYNNTITELAGVRGWTPVYRELYEHVIRRRTNFLMDYRSDEFKQTSDGTWTTVKLH